MNTLTINSVSDILTHIYELTFSSSTYRFRGQAVYNWPLQPSIYRFNELKRYQTFLYEKILVKLKPQKPIPPITHTNFDLEWLMLCQHYEIPTRLMDWSTDVLIALFFSCYENKYQNEDGALFICNQKDYTLLTSINENPTNLQDLYFINTPIINPRMRAQSGCFMIWGHAPLKNSNSTESYDLWQYQNTNTNSYFIEKICIPKDSKKHILNELKNTYSISTENVLINGNIETNFTSKFPNLKNKVYLITQYITDADKLNEEEEKEVRGYLKIECRNMFHNCFNLRVIDGLFFNII